MIQLDHGFIAGFRSQHQMTVGRQFDDYSNLIAKRSAGVDLTSDEQTNLDRLTRELTPYSTERHASLQSPHTVRYADKFGTTNAVVLNIQKVAAANLSGAERLTVARETEALGKLMRKPTASLSVGEKFELDRLKDKLVRFVGPADRPGRVEDFRVMP